MHSSLESRSRDFIVRASLLKSYQANMQQQDVMFMVMERLNSGASNNMLEQQRLRHYPDHHNQQQQQHQDQHHHQDNYHNNNHQDSNPVASRLPQVDLSFMTLPPGTTPSMPNATYVAKQHDSCALSALHGGRNHQNYHNNPTHLLNNNQQRKKAKRIRTTFTPEQLKRLEDEFSHQPYLVGQYRQFLATTLGLTEGQVKVWFQNRRIKQRKNELK